MTQQPHYWAYTQRNHNSKCHMKHSVHCSTIYSSQDMQATQMPISSRMNKDVVRIYSGILLSHKRNKTFAEMYMDLETVRKRKTSIVYYNAYIWLRSMRLQGDITEGLSTVKSRKMVQMILFAKHKQRHRHREEMYGYQEGSEEWDELGDWD